MESSSTGPRLTLSLAPAQNTLNTLMALAELTGHGHSAHASGYLRGIAKSATAQQLHSNAVLVGGLGDALLTDEEWPSFPAYVDALAAAASHPLRDSLLERLAGGRGEEEIDRALEDEERFRSLLGENDGASAGELVTLMRDPPRLQTVLVAHLRSMWGTVLRDEWERTASVLEAMVRFYQQRTAAVPHWADAYRVVTGQDPVTDIPHAGRKPPVLVPSPYMNRQPVRRESESVWWVFFGMPEHPGLHRRTPVQEGELLSRINALADRTRLQILTMLTERGEVSSAEIAEEFELSQPTASRHLKQLSEAGFLLQRRAGGAAKTHRVTPGHVELTFRALEDHLFGRVTAQPERAHRDSELDRFLDDAGRLTTWPAKRKDQMLVLTYLASHFQPERAYNEREVNEILGEWHTWNDPAKLRRALFDDRLLDRTNDGSRYWRADSSMAESPPTSPSST